MMRSVILVGVIALIVAATLLFGIYIDAAHGPCAREDLRWPRHPSRTWMWGKP